MNAHTFATAGKNGNNFDLLRLFAASAVIFSHSFGLVTSGGHASSDPLYLLTRGQMTFGELGVYIFFIASGFLITSSVQRSSGLTSYFTKRLLRIIPGLMFVVLVSILIIGPIFTSLPLAEYFTRAETFFYVRNVLMFFSQAGLPGVFADNPLADMVNGSLWTLKFEVFCYFLVAMIWKFRRLNAMSVVLLTIACAIAGKIYHGPGSGYIFYSAFFLSGSSLFLLREYVPMSRIVFAIMTLILATSAALGGLQIACALVGSYCLLYLAYASNHGDRFRRRFGDYSYGIYLFGFPVQQGVVAIIGAAVTWQQVFFIAYPVTLALAIISWRLIEEPVLRIRESLAPRSGKKTVAQQAV